MNPYTAQIGGDKAPNSTKYAPHHPQVDQIGGLWGQNRRIPTSSPPEMVCWAAKRPQSKPSRGRNGSNKALYPPNDPLMTSNPPGQHPIHPCLAPHRIELGGNTPHVPPVWSRCGPDCVVGPPISPLLAPYCAKQGGLPRQVHQSRPGSSASPPGNPSSLHEGGLLVLDLEPKAIIHEPSGD